MFLHIAYMHITSCIVTVQVAEHGHPNNITCALILAVSVCYHSRLQDREEYETIVSSKFVSPLALPGLRTQFTNEIAW